MDVFITGATGALGRPTVRTLIAAGHRVRALAHSAPAAERLRTLGANPIAGSLNDAESLRRAVAGADAVLHLATRLPPMSRAGTRAAWAENDRIRTEGTRNLVDAALASDVGTFVYPSTAFVYADHGDRWIDAESGQTVVSAPNLRSNADAEAEVARFGAGGRRGIVLRMGGFYGERGGFTDAILAMARRGIAPIFGSSEAYHSAVWIDDAAEAVVAALNPDVAGGVYDVVDDEPLTGRELAGTLAAAAGRRRVWRPPKVVAEAMAGLIYPYMAASVRVSNRRFTEASGWTPRVRSGRDGWPRAAEAAGLATNGGADWRTRLGLGYLAGTALVVGVWAQLFPASFFAAFPGLGRAWVSADGPFNEHLLRDTGGLHLALAALFVYALARPTPGLVRASALAALTFGAPHLIYHAVTIELLPTALDRALELASLAGMPLVGLGLLLAGPRDAPLPVRTTNPAARPTASAAP